MQKLFGYKNNVTVIESKCFSYILCYNDKLLNISVKKRYCNYVTNNI